MSDINDIIDINDNDNKNSLWINTKYRSSEMADNVDHLCLAGNAKVKSLLEKQTDGEEEVKFSDFVIKINRKGKEQTRTILITDKAVYNLMPNNYGNVKRRIPISSIEAVSTSSGSDEFVIHIPDE